MNIGCLLFYTSKPSKNVKQVKQNVEILIVGDSYTHPKTPVITKENENKWINGHAKNFAHPKIDLVATEV